MRLKALIAYDGTSFYGWQIQKNYPTIQSTIEESLQHICRRPVEVVGAGRTDSGVHALEQVAHFDWEHLLPPDKLILAMNGNLPPAIRILSLQQVDLKFHARFDARSKTYLYCIHRSRFSSPFTFRYSLQYSFPLDLELMNRCARMIKGEHDYVAFQATGSDVVTTRRTVLDLAIIDTVGAHPPNGGPQRTPPPIIGISFDRWLFVRIHATGFLRKMVRFLVGTILEIGSGKRPFEDLVSALETGDRRYVGVPVPARGLFLERVRYEVDL